MNIENVYKILYILKKVVNSLTILYKQFILSEKLNKKKLQIKLYNNK